jgi:hypothetical protein
MVIVPDGIPLPDGTGAAIVNITSEFAIRRHCGAAKQSRAAKFGLSRVVAKL